MSAKSKKFLGSILILILFISLMGFTPASTNIPSVNHPLFDLNREHTIIRVRQFFTQEELLEMIEFAPDQSETLHSTPHPFRAMTPEEVEAWSAEYFEMGGLNAQELETIFWLNEERIAYGLPPFAVCPYLSQAARLSAQLLAEQWEPGSQNHLLRHGDLPPHTDPHYGWGTARALLFAPDDPYSISVPENLTITSLGSARAVDNWMYSPGHRIIVLAEAFDFSTLDLDWENGIMHVGVGVINNIFAMKIADIRPPDHPIHTFFD